MTDFVKECLPWFFSACPSERELGSIGRVSVLAWGGGVVHTPANAECLFYLASSEGYTHVLIVASPVIHDFTDQERLSLSV